MPTQENTVNFAALLQAAVTEPGKISTCYSAFWNYSLCNQLLAMAQCEAREIPIGPIASFMGWKEHGRHVKKGAKAITLCMPVTGKRERTEHNDATGQDESTTVKFTRFIWKANWFVVSQTEGEEFTPAVPGFDFTLALQALEIERAAFESLDGNCQGYATARKVAVSPVASHPERTLLHEIAHVVLGHTAEAQMNDNGERTPRDVRELEAECTAMLCAAALGLPGIEESRGYVQSWYKGSEVPEANARRIFHAVDQILKAGRN